MKRILIVDDHPVVRQGMKAIIAAEVEGVECHEAANATEAQEALRLTNFDLVLLDINLPDRNGFTVLDEVRRKSPGLPVLVISMQPEEHLAVRALKAGAMGFLNKESAPEELTRAVRTALAGKKCVSERLAEWLADGVGARRDGLPHDRLSDREYQVMCLIAAGKSISEISESLSRSANTISTYRTRIMRKMGISNNAGLTQYALTHQLIK